MKRLIDYVNGKKTYIVASLTAFYAVLGVVLGYHDIEKMYELLIIAGGMVGFRSALNK